MNIYTAENPSSAFLEFHRIQHSRPSSTAVNGYNFITLRSLNTTGHPRWPIPSLSTFSISSPPSQVGHFPANRASDREDGSQLTKNRCIQVMVSEYTQGPGRAQFQRHPLHAKLGVLPRYRAPHQGIRATAQRYRDPIYTSSNCPQVFHYR